MSILHRARLVHTLDPSAPGTAAGAPATGVLVADGRVVAVGDADTLRSSADEVVDHGDGVITPGLVDGHTHPVHGLELTAGADLSGVRDLAEVRQRLAAHRQTLGPGEWLQGWGLNPAVFDGAAPTSAALGIDGGPAFLRMYDAHSAIASPEALAIAGVDGAREFNSAARVECDTAGRPTGYLLESDASELVRVHVPEPTLADYTRQFGDLLRGMAASGLTGIHAMDFSAPSEELVRAAEAAGDLPVRIGFNLIVDPETPDLDEVLAAQSLVGRRWRVEGVKLFVDGTVDGGTAWLEYADTHGEGLAALWRDVDAFRDVVTRLHLAGVSCAVHAIGDRGVREVLELFEDLRRDHGPLARHRIEHIETVPDEVVEAFGRDAAAASMQPLHCTFFNFPDRSDSWSQRLGDVRVDRGFRWADLRAAGATLALGSDWPIAPYDPRWTMADAQLRHHFGHDHGPLPSPRQALTALQALEGYTTHAALASGEEDHRGRLAPGYDADLTVFADDPLSVVPEEMAVLPVLGTVVAGIEVAS